MVLPEIEEEADDPSGRRASKLSLTSLLLGKYFVLRLIKYIPSIETQIKEKLKIPVRQHHYCDHVPFILFIPS